MSCSWRPRAGTNREIAYQLYVTLKTIEGHLARAYTKLGIDRRRQLSKFFEGRKNQGANPLAKDFSLRDPSARTAQSDGGSNDTDRARGFRKGDGHLQRP